MSRKLVFSFSTIDLSEENKTLLNSARQLSTTSRMFWNSLNQEQKDFCLVLSFKAAFVALWRGKKKKNTSLQHPSAEMKSKSISVSEAVRLLSSQSHAVINDAMLIRKGWQQILLSSTKILDLNMILCFYFKRLFWKWELKLRLFVTGRGAAARQGGSTQSEGQFLGSRPPASHPGHSGTGRGQSHGPTALLGHPAEAGQRGTHSLTHYLWRLLKKL